MNIMALNTSQRAIREQRREAVAALRLRRRTQREIVDALRQQGLVNPDSGEPWSLGTVNGDVQWLERSWRAAAAADIERLKGAQLAEIWEARRLAWELGDVNQVRQLIKLEMELLGTESPKRTEVSGRDGGAVVHEHKGQVHGDIEHLAAVLGTLVGAGAVALPDDAGGVDAEDDVLHSA